MKSRHILSLQAVPLFAFLAAALLTAPAHAQATFPLALTLTPDAQVGAVGDTLYFSGMLSNATANSVFLNSESFSFMGPLPDGSPFVNNAPISLDPVGTMDGMGNPTDSYSGSFFDLTLDPSVAPGTYSGSVTIIGGADASASDIVAREGFAVTVLPSPQAVPEASTTISMGLLLLLGGGLVSAKRRHTASAV